MNPTWVYGGQHVPQKNIIILGFAHDYDQILTAPEATAGAEVVRQYGRAAAAAKLIAVWLRQQGWDAEPLTGPMTTKVMKIPPAIAGGFGELGKHGSLINAEFCSSFRISAVLTDAPFMPTPERSFYLTTASRFDGSLRLRGKLFSVSVGVCNVDFSNEINGWFGLCI